MNIKLLSIGKTDDPALQQLISMYSERLGHYSKFDFEVITDIKKKKNLSQGQQKLEEGKKIIDRLNSSDFVVLLDENGRNYSSEAFAEYLQKRFNSGMKQLIFVIGGPFGFSDEVYARADTKLSLSRMTFSHQMVRLFFVEQLYRAFTILKNEPYHHK